MKGDFSRETFDKSKHFSSVRMQQGRVQLDADWNEQMAIWDHRIQTETNDFIGDSGTPAGEHNGYAVTIKTTTAESQTQYHLNITKGRYYVNGLLVENEQDVSYTTQIDYPKATLPTNDGLYLAYLDVWQQGISGAEDASIEEPALGGADTTTRIKNIAQVKLLALDKTGVSQPTCIHLFDKTSTLTSVKKNITTWNGLINPSHQGKMQARTNTAPNLKNQLYRIEIHQSGTENKATFKWSRDNGATVVPIATISGNIINIKSAENLILSFKAKQWVELNTHQRILQGKTGIFVQLLRVEKSQLTITLWPSGVNPSEFINGTLRLWNVNPTLLSQSPFTLLDTTKTTLDKGKTILTLSEGEDTQGTLLKTLQGKSIELTNQSFITQKKKAYFFEVEAINEKNKTITISDLANVITQLKLDRFRVITPGVSTTDTNNYLLLEDGLEIKFTAGNYKTGDYWLIPTRAVTNKIDSKLLTPQLPTGIKHYYTRLALVEKTSNVWKLTEDCRYIFGPLTNKAYQASAQAQPNSVNIDSNSNVSIKKALSVNGNTQTGSLTVNGDAEIKTNLKVTGTIKDAKGDVMPKGGIIMWSGTETNVPAGWALCNGSNGTPDLRDRFILAAGSTYKAKTTGGSHTHTLTVAEMPSHNHSGTTDTKGRHQHSFTLYNTGFNYSYSGSFPTSDFKPDGHGTFTRTTTQNGDHSHSLTINKTGNNRPHNNMPAYYTLAFIMKL